MLTQDGSGVPFEVSANQQNLRLLELPSSLVDLLRSGNPPRSAAGLEGICDRNADHEESLFLKSVPSPSHSATTLSASGNAVLCTNDQTYQLRQVHSSNSVFVLQPSHTSLNDREDAGLPMASVQAVAQCATTLELKPSTRSRDDFLKGLLPQYTGPEDNTDNCFPSQLMRGKDRICKDAPLSRAEFEAAWVTLCAFELENIAFLPTATALHEVWKSILSATVVKSLKLEDNVFIQTIAGLVEEDGFPRSLLQAVVNRLSVDHIVPMEGWTTFSPDECIPWVGAIILEASTASTEGILTSGFLQQWRDSLPESWRKRVSLIALEGRYLQPAKDRIRSHDPAAGAGSLVSSETVDTSEKRLGKWHEKFKNARR